jgi:hypothetical protein
MKGRKGEVDLKKSKRLNMNRGRVDDDVDGL